MNTTTTSISIGMISISINISSISIAIPNHFRFECTVSFFLYQGHRFGTNASNWLG